jgi:hypothetical protein
MVEKDTVVTVRSSFLKNTDISFVLTGLKNEIGARCNNCERKRIFNKQNHLLDWLVIHAQSCEYQKHWWRRGI